MCFMTEPEDDLLYVETCCSTDKQTLLSKKLVLELIAISVVYIVDPQWCVNWKNYRTHCSTH
jgi:hypothetical protein